MGTLHSHRRKAEQGDVRNPERKQDPKELKDPRSRGPGYTGAAARLTSRASGSEESDLEAGRAFKFGATAAEVVAARSDVVWDLSSFNLP